MSEPYLVGVIGARGHVGRELLRLIGDHPELMLAYAGSREFAGRRVAEIAPEIHDDIEFEALDAAAAAERRADAVILALPDGAAAGYVEAIEQAASHRRIIDLSADYRFDDEWTYGLPERNRAALLRARRIANPGCYATAMQLAVAPMLDMLSGPPSVFGVSGYSGAGTTPSPRNDETRLADNLMPYALTGHKHEREATRHLGAPVRFSPHVHPAFRGLTVTAHLPLAKAMDAADLRAIFDRAYGEEPLIAVQGAPPELKDGAGRDGVLIGGFSVSDGAASTNGAAPHAVVVAAEDNLLKGAAVQAVQNLNLSLGLAETTGLLRRSA
ncbi:MAG: N-acetyl-gamma-glutamyl-phosphate reductase [Pseudomonadota bacterium]